MDFLSYIKVHDEFELLSSPQQHRAKTYVTKPVALACLMTIAPSYPRRLDIFSSQSSPRPPSVVVLLIGTTSHLADLVQQRSFE